MEKDQLDRFNFQSIPVIDVSSFVKKEADKDEQERTAKEIREVCKASGFFYIKNHGIDPDFVKEFVATAREYFALSLEEKMKCHMKLGGRAWRGYFPVGEQLTSGKIDLKEGLYLGQELPDTHELVQKGVPLHGRNQFPQQPAKLKALILSWIGQLKHLGDCLMSAIAASLKLPLDYFAKNICKDPLCLFRIFNYPLQKDTSNELWGVGQHTDYGLLTILLITDEGLEVKNRSNNWVKAPPIEGTFIINIGDMLQRLTHGLYRSTPHRARNQQVDNRMSFPFFYDPGWNEKIHQLEIVTTPDEQSLLEQTKLYERWDKQNLSQVSGTYGDYLTRKVAKVFPDLSKDNLDTNVAPGAY